MSLTPASTRSNIPETPLPIVLEQKDATSTGSNPQPGDDLGESGNQARSSNDSKFDQEQSKQKKAKSPVLKPQVVRQKLTQRQRSISSPLIHRPIPSSGHAEVVPPETSSLPKLTDKSPKITPKALTQQQQLAIDLADLVEKMLLRNKGSLNDPIDVSNVTANLQCKFYKKYDDKIFLENLMQQLFSEDLKKSEAWNIAQDIIAKIRINHFYYYDTSVAPPAEKQKEATDMLGILAAHFAGAFFNISGKESNNRLPASLEFFIKEIDHRQIKILLSDDKGIALSQDNFHQLRKEWVAKILIDAFLVPLVQTEFFTIRGIAATDQVVSQIIFALHNAFAISSRALLQKSLKAAPEDVLNLVKKRRAAHFKPRINRLEKSPEKASEAQQSQPTQKLSKQLMSSPRSMLSASPSPSHQRRIELQRMLKKLVAQLARENEKIPASTLAKIKEFNNSFAPSDQPISEVNLYRSWLSILKENNAESSLVNALARMINEVVTNANEQAVLDKEFLEIELLTKLNAIEQTGQTPLLERATRLSSNRPLNPVGSFISPTNSPSKFVSTTSFNQSLNSSSTPEISSVLPASPESPTARKLQQHRRMRTADVMPVRFGNQRAGLTEQERLALINAYPDLLIATIQPLIYRKTDQGSVLRKDPVSEIIVAGRNKFSIPLESMPKALREKIKTLKSLPDDAESISHAELLKLLLMQELQSSAAGKAIIDSRQQALRSAGSSPSADVLNDQPKLKAEKSRLLALFEPEAKKITMSLFGGELPQSGLPSALIKLWKQFDQKLVEWASSDLELSDEDLDKMRSTLGFDLIVTRMIYPLCIGINEANPSLLASSFADAVRLSTLPSWVTFFQQFKQS